jgi:nucleotide-binding universal stress UspA family protein
MLSRNQRMATPRHILVPYDFSTQSVQVVPFVRALASRFGARVTLLSVVPPTFEPVPAGMGGPRIRAGEDAAEWRHNLQRELDQALLKELTGLCVDRIAVGGDPAIQITEVAHAHDVDLIMMPTHGVGTFRSFLVGSVTAKVLHDAACPVWTAAHATSQVASNIPRLILCAIDGSAATSTIVHWAAEFAQAAGARLNLLHVVGPISDWPALESEQRLQEHVRADAREQIGALLKSAGIEAPLRVAVGGIVQTVSEEARQEQADLMIIGRGSVPEPFGRLRTHAFSLIQRSPCPVVSV